MATDCLSLKNLMAELDTAHRKMNRLTKSLMLRGQLVEDAISRHANTGDIERLVRSKREFGEKVRMQGAYLE